MKENIKRFSQNVAALLFFLTGIKNIIFALPIDLKRSYSLLIYFDNETIQSLYSAHIALTFLSGLLMVLIANRLYKRVKAAWVMAVILLFISILAEVLGWSYLFIPSIILDASVLLVLLFSHKAYNRKTNKVTIKRALIMVGISFFLILMNTIISLFLINGTFFSFSHLGDALDKSFQLIFLMDKSVLQIHSNMAIVYANAIIIINWTCLILGIGLLLKPLVVKPKETINKEKIREIVVKYGQNPMSYLALESDKKYFLGNQIEGVVAYRVVRNIFVCCGDMICNPKDGPAFLEEVEDFCQQNDWKILFLNTTDYFLDLYKEHGFGSVKCGEDACFKLDGYTLAGGKTAKVRAAVNKANREGLTVHEYKPLIEKEPSLEKEMEAISKEWLRGKNMSKLEFMLGDIGFENPMDKRYFYAKENKKGVVGFVVYIPYNNKKAYLADMTQYKKDAPYGILEKIIYESFMIMKEEGLEVVSLGLSPLYNVTSEDKVVVSEKLFDYIYHHFNKAYGFKNLHDAKKKYAPTHWESRYFVFKPSLFSPKYAYAMVKAQNPGGVFPVIRAQLSGKKAD